MESERGLSNKSQLILGLIAEGHSYAQIVDGNKTLSYLDIFAAAEEALRLSETETDYHARMAKIKTRHPRAYERWSADEDERLGQMYKRKEPIASISAALERQPSAIRSRLHKLGLLPADSPH